MRNILVVGAGKSTSYLLDYFLDKAATENLHLTIGELHPTLVPEKVSGHPACTVVHLDIF